MARATKSNGSHDGEIIFVSILLRFNVRNVFLATAYGFQIRLLRRCTYCSEISEFHKEKFHLHFNYKFQEVSLSFIKFHQVSI